MTLANAAYAALWPAPQDARRHLSDEIARWNEVGPRYGLEVLGPPIPA